MTIGLRDDIRKIIKQHRNARSVFDINETAKQLQKAYPIYDRADLIEALFSEVLRSGVNAQWGIAESVQQQKQQIIEMPQDERNLAELRFAVNRPAPHQTWATPQASYWRLPARSRGSSAESA